MKRKKKTMDGNSAAAYASYAFTDVASIYPITPSSVMADEVDKYSSSGKKNLFGRQVKVVELQSEAGAAGTMHGSLSVGALTTTYTASQGLLLMIPNMYKIAGELLPSVIHVSARTIASHALSIFGDHSDIYACRQTGYAMLCSNSPQEVMDLGVAAHLAAIKGRIPFLHFFDGFRTSHEVQKIDVWSYDQLDDMLDKEAVSKFRDRSLNPERPELRGTAQNDDIFFQWREACNKFYDAVPDAVIECMNEINRRAGTDYKPFNYYGDKEAENIIIAMGSVCETDEEVIDYLKEKGEKVGLVKVRLYRPFSAKHLLDVIPSAVKKISVLDRTKEPGSIGEPLYLDVAAAISEYRPGIKLYGGRYGLSSKDTTPGQIIAVYNNMKSSEPKKRFTIGIEDDVTNLSLNVSEEPDTTPKGTYSCKFWGLGSDGTVGANKNSIKIIGDHTDMYVQGYFAYDSKKSGGVTLSHLRFGSEPVKSTYYISQGDFIACHNPSYVHKYDMVQDLKKGGSFLLNCSWDDSELDKYLPDKMKKFIAENDIKLYTIDGMKIGREIGLGGRINTILQAAFFKIVEIIPIEKAIEFMKKAALNTYGDKGDNIVNMNYEAIDRGAEGVHRVKIPDSWKEITIKDAQSYPAKGSRFELVKYVDNILKPVDGHKGSELPVSAFLDYVDGTVPQGSSAYEKRGIAIDVPKWIPENCIQCNFCSYVCPHAVIRPCAMTKEERENAPEGTVSKKMTGFPDMEFAVTVSALDCTGCGNCAEVCPGMKGNKALVMSPAAEQIESQKLFNYAGKLPDKPYIFDKFKGTSVKGSQFKKPLLEFSGACAGCGETPYARLATQLFGDRMYIANATGCSSIWGASAPSTPYTVNQEGKGPAWQNSLFEDNAEFGYGMSLGHDIIRRNLIECVKEIKNLSEDQEVQEACSGYLDTTENSGENSEFSKTLLNLLQEKGGSDERVRLLSEKVINNKNYLSKKSIWMFGGDGWAYDIGFGGLDHVIASGEDVNILIFDTEVYSNTGGQASKATPTGSVAQFASSGKSSKKKDLAAIAMTYGYVYVAQVAMGANYNQCIKAFTEAESYKGPSVIIAYAPCIAHGIKGGMGFAKAEEKRAVECGYWNLLRFDPRLASEGKNPFILDSKEPKLSYREFIMNETRYSALERSFPERAEALFNKAEELSLKRYKYLKNLSDGGCIDKK